MFRVETAGAPVSPRMSAPKPLDRRRARGILSLERGVVVLSNFGRSREERSGKGSKSAVAMVEGGVYSRCGAVRLPPWSCVGLIAVGIELQGSLLVIVGGQRLPAEAAAAE